MTYLFPIATTSTTGVVQAGTNISIDAAGVISTVGGSGSTSGTWTPTFVSSLGGTIAITVATANYVKTGQNVTCYFDFTELTETGGGVAGTMSINGLPFASIAGTGIVGTAMVNYFENLNANETFITGTVAGAASQVLLWATHQVSTSVRLTQNDVKPTTRLVGTITYQSAS
jgi:hypothetical protein